MNFQSISRAIIKCLVTNNVQNNENKAAHTGYHTDLTGYQSSVGMIWDMQGHLCGFGPESSPESVPRGT